MSKYYKAEDIQGLITACMWRMTLVKERNGEGFVEYNKKVLDVDELRKRLLTLPTIEVVHCEECKKAHLTYDGFCKYCEEWKDDDGNYIEVYHDGGHFCSYGARIFAKDINASNKKGIDNDNSKTIVRSVDCSEEW